MKSPSGRSEAGDAAAGATVIASGPYRFPLNGRLTPDSTTLLAIDMQGDFCRPGGFMDRLGLPFEALQSVLPRAAALLERFRALGFPVIHTRETFRPDLSDAQVNRLWRGPDGRRPIVGDSGPLGRHLVAGEPGWAIMPEVAPHDGELVFDKPSYGAFGTTTIDAALRAGGIRNLIVCGVTSDCCVRTIVAEALDRGYDCLTVSDATGATSPDLHRELMWQIAIKGGVLGAVADAAAVLDALPA
ncbi:MAG: cysteine hydrolase [Gluconacetobacter diazotrophicus]|nr:cysteine hydrolase [Gluconacetobacter diazotrophicus]